MATDDKSAYPSDAADKFVVRFPDGMRDQIAAAAKSSGRSMNAEIVSRLSVTLDPLTVWLRSTGLLAQAEACAGATGRTLYEEVSNRLSDSLNSIVPEMVVRVQLNEAKAKIAALEQEVERLRGLPHGAKYDGPSLGKLYDMTVEMRKELKSQQEFINRLLRQGFAIQVDDEGRIKGSRTFAAGELIDGEKSGPLAARVTIEGPPVPMSGKQPPTSPSPQPTPPARKRKP